MPEPFYIVALPGKPASCLYPQKYRYLFEGVAGFHIQETLGAVDNSATIRIRLQTLADLKVAQKGADGERSLNAEGLFGQHFYNNQESTYYPTIHITLIDIFDDDVAKQIVHLPRYAKVMDSSIWNYYVPVYRTDDGERGFQNRLNSAIDAIKRNYGYNQATQQFEAKNNLYQLDIAKEQANLNYRLVRESYLIKDGGHGEDVSPFLFHSETKMSELLQKEINRIPELFPQKTRIEWQALLIDDKSEAPMSGEPEGKTKKEAIKDCLRELKQLISSAGPYELSIQFDAASTIDQAKKALLFRRYDIIFLDYLLDKKDTGEREYGYQLLDFVNEILKSGDEPSRTEWKNAKGIYGHFWFFNISSFSHAIEERLRERGLAYYTKNWNFSRGASPVITPELFKYELFRFLLHQIEIITHLPSLPKDTAGASNEVIPRIVTPIDLLNAIYRCGNIRKNAVTYFNSALSIKANYRRLKDDLEYKNGGDNGSLLVRSLFPDLGRYKNAFWEHLMHLVYVTAFGTIRQWPEMWEELLFIKPYLQDEGVLIAIEKHIIDLKTAMES